MLDNYNVDNANHHREFHITVAVNRMYDKPMDKNHNIIIHRHPCKHLHIVSKIHSYRIFFLLNLKNVKIVSTKSTYGKTLDVHHLHLPVRWDHQLHKSDTTISLQVLHLIPVPNIPNDTPLDMCRIE